MSTYYVENPMNLESVENHYIQKGWNVTVWGTIDDFEESMIPEVEDVFICKEEVCIITKTEYETDIDLTMYYMDADEFMTNWSKKVWDKFREDSYTTVCPKCGNKMAHAVSGKTLSDIGRIEQFHCDGCHYTWVGYPSGLKIREGVLMSEWDIQ